MLLYASWKNSTLTKKILPVGVSRPHGLRDVRWGSMEWISLVMVVVEGW